MVGKQSEHIAMLDLANEEYLLFVLLINQLLPVLDEDNLVRRRAGWRLLDHQEHISGLIVVVIKQKVEGIGFGREEFDRCFGVQFS